ncbi:General negative regulator of transcription subunit 4 [Neolecta irregularis DAH-3]|uniref:General negative regulator of transcription subunit 4 n=1 Tax=Neolecta irregularis (strain DAH-3) TaxID=1198029 RepID=A0A1U7LTE0_NEOID|nr:General negative regulator of transcription subunit 4 [Neolecta irregularis DAH-3]|eukprot:OLL25812.1 General negative regulator of transcription subunit 4 [Neolecta irregularis DAH-3]
MSLSNRHDDHSGSDEDEMDCPVSPLCMEEMDLADRTFRPCQCGYQVCCFCWNNIRQNLNGKCPACRRPYDDRPIEFTPVTQVELLNDQKRQQKINEEKKRKEREKREMEVMNRKHLASVRVQQKNLVYVTGLIPKIQNEELEQTLRSHEYFGQYGKILKVVVNNRNTTGQRNQANSQKPVQVYITFARKEDAARAIHAVDGSVNDGKVLHASLGTTKYCTAYLRNQPCQNPNCMYLHEPGEETDSYSYSREDFSSLQHAMKQNEQKQRIKNLRPVAMEHSQSENALDHTPLPAKVSWATNKLSRSNTPVSIDHVEVSPVKKPIEFSPPSIKIPPAKLPQSKQNSKSPQKLSGKFRFTKPAASPEPFYGAFEKTLAALCDGSFKYVFASAVLGSDEFRNAQSMPPLFTYSKDAARRRREAEGAKAVLVDQGFDPFDAKRVIITKTPVAYHTQMVAPPGVSQPLSTGNYPIRAASSTLERQFQQPLGGPTYKTTATPPPGIFSPQTYNEHSRQTSREGALRDQIYAPQARRTDGIMSDRGRLDLQGRSQLTRSDLADPAILSMRPSPLPQQGFMQQGGYNLPRGQQPQRYGVY